uniref:Uncharacterized protein n=1 Tax=Oryza brachyantha TaxID=4533 RepID=J3M848_ORYBR
QPPLPPLAPVLHLLLLLRFPSCDLWLISSWFIILLILLCSRTHVCCALILLS